MVHIATLQEIRIVSNPVKAVVNPTGGYDVYQKGDTIPPNPGS